MDNLSSIQSTPGWATRFSGDGIHMFDRRTGVNILFDEVEVPIKKWSLAPRHVSIALLNACDLRCEHCYAPKIPARLRGETVQSWFAELGREGCLGVGFGGGEPTLHKDLPALCRYVTEETLMSVSITTHGHHLDEAMKERLSGNVNFIRLSMDGMGDTYEKIRGRSFEGFVRRLIVARSISTLGINYVVNDLTIHDLKSALLFAGDQGVREFLILPQQQTRTVSGIEGEVLNRLSRIILDYSGGVKLSVSESYADFFLSESPFVKDVGLRAYGHIDASGLAKRSSFHPTGVQIDDGGVLAAFNKINNRKETMS